MGGAAGRAAGEVAGEAARERRWLTAVVADGGETCRHRPMAPSATQPSRPAPIHNREGGACQPWKRAPDPGCGGCGAPPGPSRRPVVHIFRLRCTTRPQVLDQLGLGGGGRAQRPHGSSLIAAQPGTSRWGAPLGGGALWVRTSLYSHCPPKTHFSFLSQNMWRFGRSIRDLKYNCNISEVYCLQPYTYILCIITGKLRCTTYTT